MIASLIKLAIIKTENLGLSVLSILDKVSISKEKDRAAYDTSNPEEPEDHTLNVRPGQIVTLIKRDIETTPYFSDVLHPSGNYLKYSTFITMN